MTTSARSCVSAAHRVAWLLAALLLVTSAVVALPGQARAASAAEAPVGELCSGVAISGGLTTPDSRVEYEIYVPAGGVLRIEGEADILEKDTTGGWQTILRISPAVYSLLGSYWGGPYSDQGFSGEWTQGDTGGMVPVVVTQQYGTKVNYRFTATVNGAVDSGCASSVPQPPITGDEVLGGCNAAQRNNCGQAHTSLPVDTSTGNFWHTFDDLRIPGRGFPLALSRTYNSAAASRAGMFGYGWSSTYDISLAASGSTATLSQENGAKTGFTLNGSTWSPASPRVTAALTKNSDGTYTVVRNKAQRLKFSSTGRLVSLTDLNGYTTSLTRPSSTSFVVKEPAGRTLTFTLASGRVTKVVDSSARTMSFSYDGSGNLTSVTDVNGGKASFTYDSAHRMLTMRSPRFAADTSTSPARVVTNTYDAQGRVTVQTDPLGRTTGFAYAGDWTAPAGSRSTVVTDPSGRKTQYSYSSGALVEVRAALGTPLEASTRLDYDPDTAGVSRVTDPLGRSTATTYDDAGNATSITDALGRVTKVTYNSLEEPLTLTDPAGRVSTFTYDSKGNLLTTSVVKTEGTARTDTTTLTYGDTSKPGDVTKVTDPAGAATAFTYTANGDVASVADPVGGTATMTYDGLGRLVTGTSPRGNASGSTAAAFTTTYDYDAMGRQTSVKDPLWSSSAPTQHQVVSAYDADGNLTSRTDGAGTTKSTYDAAGQLTATTRPDGSLLRTVYFLNGAVKSQLDGLGSATTYAYDALGRVSTSTDPLGRATTYGYDAAGNLVSEAAPGGSCGTSPSGCTTYAYDAADQLLSTSYSDGKTPGVSYAYDALGRRTTMKDGSGTTSYVYDSLGMLTSVTNGAGAIMKYGYDRVGNQTSVTYPNTKAITRTFDAAGRMTALKDWNGKSTTFSFDADSNPVAAAMPNGIASMAGFDALGNMTSNANAKGSFVIGGYTGTYDGEGRMASSGTTGFLAEPTTSYSYDQVSRLTKAGGLAYAYDKGDNPTTLAGATQAFDKANQLVSSTAGGGTTYAYDARGNRTTTTPKAGLGTTASYDQADRTTSVKTSSTTGYATTVRADSPQAYFRLSDAPASTVKDSVSGSTYYAELSGTAVRQAPGGLKGDVDTALNFYNGDGQGRMPASPANTVSGGDTTVEMLVRWQGPQSTPESLFAFSSGYQLVFSGGNLGFSTTAGAPDVYGVDGTWLADRWVHVVAVFRNGSVTASKLYLDGVAQTLTQKAGTPKAVSATSAASFSGNAAGDLHLNGTIDELAMWGSALTAAQVTKHATAAQSYVAAYTYDGDGLRVSKATGSVKRALTYDVSAGYAQLIADGVNYYVYGPDGLPLEQVKISDGTTQWYAHDVLGNTRFLTDSSANKSAEYTYDAYGRITGSGGRVDTPLRYRGEQQDSDTGFVYLRARFYDPATAQFTTRDPLVAVTGSAYGYAYNSPLNFTDPSGESAGKDFVGGVLNGTVGSLVDLVAGSGTTARALSAKGFDTCSAAFKIGTVSGIALSFAGSGGLAGSAMLVGRLARVETVVIGRGMQTRVIPFAVENGFKHYSTTRSAVYKGLEQLHLPAERFSLWLNKNWIRSQMARGAKIVDIGGDLDSPYYRMEIEQLKGYGNYVRLLQP